MTELQKRVVTGVLGAAILLGLIIFGGWPGMFLIVLVLSLAMVNEYATICLTMGDRTEKRYLLLCLTWLAAVCDLALVGTSFEVFVFCFLALFVYFLMTARRHEAPEAFALHFRELAYCVLGLLYVGFVPLFLGRIHAGAFGVHWTMVFLIIVWANDIGAYFAGMRFGKTKLYPLVSPKKTREGALGGIVAGLLGALLYKLILFRTMSWGAVFVTPILVGAAGQAGDLCESYFKRVFGKKDSGSILPGHGGMLDRFDAVVFSAPVMYACMRVFGS